MDLKCKLVKKTFTTKEGDVREYYVLQFDILGTEKLDITIKSDKAKLLLLSNNNKVNIPDIPFWSPEETNSLN